VIDVAIVWVVEIRSIHVLFLKLRSMHWGGGVTTHYSVYPP